ncbi:sigma-70 family RNA polymerase sigma factor [Flavihumibacter sediminis]|nr:sigma-70 family RNA polymerase sigma factor [Flavihumibacter sediminis]
MKEDFPGPDSNSFQHHWNAFRQHQEAGLYQLYHLTYDSFYRYGMLSSADPHIVKTAINATFIDIWSKRSNLPEVENVKGYLFICFKRQLFQAIQKETEYYNREAQQPPTLLTESSFEEAMINHELDTLRKARIRTAMASLSTRQKQFIQQRFFEDLSYEEIAEQSNTSVRTVYNTIHSAINRLRTELGETEILLLLVAWHYSY